MKVISVTGYKPHELGLYKKKDPAIDIIKLAIRNELTRYAEEGLEWVVISGQLGVELWTAEVIFDLQQTYEQLKLSVITPFLNQQERWKEETKAYYEHILAQADHVDSLYNSTYKDPSMFQAKTAFLLNKTEGAIIVYDPEHEGITKFFYEAVQQYRTSNHYQLNIIDFYSLQLTAEEYTNEQIDKNESF